MGEILDEQAQLATDQVKQVKQVASIIFQRLTTHIQPDNQYTGEQVLSRSREIIKKATLKVLSNDEDEDEEEEEEEEEQKNDDQPTNGNSVDQQTLNEEVASVQTTNSIEPDSSSTINNPKSGWDTVDDLQTEPKTPEEQTQVIIETTVTTEENSNVIPETTETVIDTEEKTDERKESDASADTIEENTEKPAELVTVLELPAKTTALDDDEDDDDPLFISARPSIQSNPTSNKVSPMIVLSFSRF